VTTIKLTDDLELFSDLLLSVGTHESKRRLIPIEVAELILRFKTEEQLTLSELSKRLDLGRPKKIEKVHTTERDPTQVTKFLNLLKLSKKSRKLPGWGRTEPDKIPFTTASIIAELPDQNEQDVIIQSSIEKGIKKNEAKRLVDLKKKTPEMPIAECIQKVLNIRPVTEISYITPYTFENEILEKLTILSKQKNQELKLLLRHILEKDITSGKIKAVVLKGNTAYISMDEIAYDFIEKQQHIKKLSFTEYMNKLLESTKL